MCLSLLFCFTVTVNNELSARCVIHSWAGGGQSHGAEVCRWSLWWKHQTHSLPLPHSEDAADSAWKRHHRRVHQKRGFQVSFDLLRERRDFKKVFSVDFSKPRTKCSTWDLLTHTGLVVDIWQPSHHARLLSLFLLDMFVYLERCTWG